MRSVETVLFLVVVAAVVAAFARRLAVPAPSLLVVAGLLIGLIPGVPEIRVTPEVVSLFVLPPLLYSAAVAMPAMNFRREFTAIRGLAVALVVLSAVVLGVFFSWAIPGLSIWWGIADRLTIRRRASAIAKNAVPSAPVSQLPFSTSSR